MMVAQSAPRTAATGSASGRQTRQAMTLPATTVTAPASASSVRASQRKPGRGGGQASPGARTGRRATVSAQASPEASASRLPSGGLGALATAGGVPTKKSPNPATTSAMN